jgi:hypothetical protein
MDDFETVDFLTDRHGVDVAPEDERNITDLYATRPHYQWFGADGIG